MLIYPALYPDGIHINNRIHRIQGSILPNLDLVINRIGNCLDKGRGILNTSDFQQVCLDLSGGHSSRIELDYLVIKTGESDFSFGDDNGLKTTVSISWDFNGHFGKNALEGFAGLADAGISAFGGNGTMFLMSKVDGHLSL